ncbi:MAG TPA: hypothetical protein VGW12_20075 [Pyrinomonadaceae bacterium]|nr:hypothetical protein [Pyrinomonadaceae bacterium]
MKKSEIPNEPTLESVIQRKSVTLMHARFLESTGESSSAKAAYRQVARDEEWIAKKLREAGHSYEEVAVNLISAASCWKKVGNYNSAIELLDGVLKAPDISPQLKNEGYRLRKEWGEHLHTSSPIYANKKTSPRRRPGKWTDEETDKQPKTSWEQLTVRPLPEAAFDSLLSWLDPERNEAWGKYKAIHQRLIKAFSRRGYSNAEDMADETINRAAMKAREINPTFIGDPELYCFGIAKKLMWDLDRQQKLWVPLEELSDEFVGKINLALSCQEEEFDQRHECLSHCMQRLEQDERDLLLAYYQKEKQARIAHRKELAQQEGITLNALRIRIHRLRAYLKECVRQCLEESVSDEME